VKLFKAIRYDLRFGIFESMKKYLFAVLLAAFIFVGLTVDARVLASLLTDNPDNVFKLPISFADVILIELGANLPVALKSAGITGFTFPTMWFLLNIIPCYLTLSYATQDLSSGGIQVITRLHSKSRWWISKCVLSIAAVCIYYIIIYAVLALLCLASGFDLSLIPDETIFSTEFMVTFVAAEVTSLQMFSALCLMPCIISAVLCLVQMTLTLFMKPVFAYMIICAYLTAAVLCVSPLFIANYAMPLRSAAIGVYNFDFASGLLCSAAVALAAIIIGRFRIVKMDIL
jgi:hypothetical protein